ncbi:MAG: potassium/proton antiporter [Micromonosporaceae bacterium]|nr:potassium/proton antiporter [Micromonosporaceae bacterium]
MTVQLTIALLIGALVLLVAVAAMRLSYRLGLPVLLVYLAIGVALGESGVGIEFEDAELTRNLGLCALLVIIAEGGLTTRWRTLRPVLGPVLALSTVGIGVSIVVMGLVLHWLLGLDLRLGMLYGAVLSSTDAAAVFATLRRLRLRPRVAAVLEAESGSNDPVAVIAVVLLSSATGGGLWWQDGLLIGYQLVVGGLVGAVAGFVGGAVLRRAALPAAGLYPLAVVGFTVLAFAVGTMVQASGFLAVYVAGVILGNARLPHRQAILGFSDGLAWLAQIGLFVLLGLLVSPADLSGELGGAIVVGVVLLLLARPVSVALSVSWFRVGPREQAFLSWAGLRGAVPIVLATIPLSEQVGGAPALFDVVFVLVVVFTLVQGTTLPAAARRLGVSAPSEATELSVETAPLERMRADLLQLEVPAGSRLAGVHLDELRLPVGAAVTLVLRDGAGFVPSPQTRLKVGDSLLVVTTAEAREATERRLRAVSRRGRLARWFGEYGNGRDG